MESAASAAAQPPSEAAFLATVAGGDDEAVGHLIDEDGTRLHIRSSDGHTPLHLAVVNGHLSLARLLLQRGADREAVDGQGQKPLYTAAQLGADETVKLLLSFDANVESFNRAKLLSALQVAVQGGNVAAAEALLEHGADVDLKYGDGRTPLMTAVANRNVAMASLLLRHGANKILRSGSDGLTASDLTKGSDEMTALLESAQLLQGPSVGAGSVSRGPPVSAYAGPLPAPDEGSDKMTACCSFQATIVDFILGDSEQRIEVNASIFDLLYGKGPHAIMKEARQDRYGDRAHSFRWYHLPANNVRWCVCSVRSSILA